MRFRRSFLFVTIAVFSAIALAGCSAGTQSSAVTASAGNAAMEDAIYVQVQSMDGNTITAVVGTLAQGMGQPDGSDRQEAGGSQPQDTPPPQSTDNDSNSQPQGAPPEQPSGDNDDVQQDNPPEMASGDGGGTKPQGGQPGGMGFTADDESITFTIDDATTITALSGPQASTTDSTQLTAADISVGDVLAVTLSSDNVALTIVIQQSGAPTGAGQQSGQPGGSFGGSDTVTNGTSASTIDTDTAVTGETYSSSGG